MGCNAGPSKASAQVHSLSEFIPHLLQPVPGSPREDVCCGGILPNPGPEIPTQVVSDRRKWAIQAPAASSKPRLLLCRLISRTGSPSAAAVFPPSSNQQLLSSNSVHYFFCSARMPYRENPAYAPQKFYQDSVLDAPVARGH